MGAAAAPASVEEMVIVWESSEIWPALEPARTSSDPLILLQENTRSGAHEFRHLAQRNLNVLCGLGTDSGTGSRKRLSVAPRVNRGGGRVRCVR